MRTTRDNFWLDAPYEPGRSLAGEHEADVAIIGGGFTGMASAYFIKRRFPGKRVIVLESEFIGFGSSGRNTGIATHLLGHNILPILSAKGVERTTVLHRLSAAALSLLDELIEEHAIDCDREHTGMLVVAETDREVRLLEKKMLAHEQIGAPLTWVDSGQLQSRFGAMDAKAAVHAPDDRMLNPAKFVRGMKKVVESLGVEVYEHSRCTHMESGRPILLCTQAGQVRAADVVLATNAYANPLALQQYKVLPFYVYNIVTEPLTEAQWDEFGWPGRENVYSTKYLFWVARPTADNRLLFIENDALYFRDIHRDYSHRPREFRSHQKKLLECFPFLKDVRITHQWGGRIGMTLDFLPSIGCTGEHKNIYYGMGYNGHGLAFAQLCGKMIAALMADEESEATDHMLVNRRLWGVPSASLSYLGINSCKLYFRLYDRWLDFGG
jgi:glycine/D-amino acid oxidase-like deaminating enzyme